MILLLNESKPDAAGSVHATTEHGVGAARDQAIAGSVTVMHDRGEQLPLVRIFRAGDAGFHVRQYDPLGTREYIWR